MKQITLIFSLTENIIFLPHIKELLIKVFIDTWTFPTEKQKLPYEELSLYIHSIPPQLSLTKWGKQLICSFSLKNNRVSNFVAHQKKINFRQGFLLSVHLKCLNISISKERCMISFYYYLLIYFPAYQCKLRFLKTYKAYLFLKFLQIFIPKIGTLWKQTSEKRDQPISQIK